MSLTKQNPDILLEHSDVYSILEIQVLNENIKNYYIEAANKFNAKLFADPATEGKHVLFPLICSNDLLIPAFNSITDMVPFNTQVKLKKTLYSKNTKQFSNTCIRLITASKHLASMSTANNNGIIQGTIMNYNFKDIQLSSFETLLYIETFHPMIVKIVDNLNNTDQVQPII